MRGCMVKILLCGVMILHGAAAVAQSRYAVMFYNVENLYDTINDPYFGDDNMLPLSDREWSGERYEKKVKSIARVVADMALLYDFPVMVGLAEVENRRVVEDVACDELLAEVDYGICHYDSDDERGIDVALIYRKDLFKLHGSRAIKVDLDTPTRDILLVWGLMCGEPMAVMVMHWPSRVGGEYETRPLREACAEKVRLIADSITQAAPQTKIIIMGDMNDTPNDRSVAKILDARSNSKGQLYNPFGKGVKRGTLVYQNRWYLYDQIIFSHNMLSGDGLHFKRCVQNTEKSEGSGLMLGTFCPNYLLDKKGYPLPSYHGDDYRGGVSDHVPVYVIMYGGK